jgi:hypothetical protein
MVLFESYCYEHNKKNNNNRSLGKTNIQME